LSLWIDGYIDGGIQVDLRCRGGKSQGFILFFLCTHVQWLIGISEKLFHIDGWYRYNILIILETFCHINLHRFWNAVIDELRVLLIGLSLQAFSVELFCGLI